MTTEHPQRCETCNPPCSDYVLVRDIQACIDKRKSMEGFSSTKGCASHSSAPAPEEKGCRCEHCEVRNDVQFCHYHKVELSRTAPTTRTVEHMQSAYAHGKMDGAKSERERVLQEQGLECWGHYQMNSKRCLKCSIAEMCYTKRECDTERAQRGES